MRTSVSVDDFIKHVYLIGRDDRLKVTSSLLAKTLQVSNPAITDMARKLSRKGLVKYEKYKALKLTTAGLTHALQLVRRHRLWETFLHEVLKLDLHSIHKEAEKLEHQSSDELIARMAEFLGNPQFDPHGDPIPGAHGEMPSQLNLTRLGVLKTGDTAKVVRLGYKSIENSVFYDKNALHLGTEITVDRCHDEEGSMDLTCDGNTFFIGKTQANEIHVIKLQPANKKAD